MATRGGYFPVAPEDRGNNKLLESDSPAPADDATSLRSNNHHSKSQKCMSSWTFSLIIIGLSVMFLVGVCLGFYVRDLQRGDPITVNYCGAKGKKLEIDNEKIGDLHETLTYYIRGEEIRQFVSEHGRNDPVTGSEDESRLEDVVLENFESYRIDSVEVEEHEVIVTGADPDRPNELDILDKNGTLLQKMVLANNMSDADNSSLSPQLRYPHVVYSPAGEVQADLVYGHYGRDTDFVMLKALGVKVKDKMMLLRFGKLSLADKVMNSESFGVRGVILYWEPQDVENDVNIPADTSYIPFASAATYSNELPTVWKPSIPCQTISSDQAKVLMSLLHLANSSILAPTSWQGSLVASYVTTGLNSDSLIVRLSVFNKPYKQTIRNIISTVQGIEEPDRYVIVGAPRSSLPGQSQDVIASSSILIQLAHSFHFVYNHHQWKPRRGVKLISWGGAGFSNSGMLHYIKTYHDLLDRRAVAYFDLSQLALGNASIIANIPPALSQLIQETTFDVPDPNNAEETLQMSWKLLSQKNSNKISEGIIPLESYHSDKSHNPFLHVLGIPEVKVQYRASPKSRNSVAAMTSEDLSHHYKFHITVTHILVKSLLVILDNELLPLNLQNHAHAIELTLWQTLDVLEQCLPKMESLYTTVTICKDIIAAAESLQEISKLFIDRSDKQGIRVVNDILMSFERMFVVHKNGKSQHILYPALDDGSLAKAGDLCEVSKVTQSRNITREFRESLTSVLKKALMLFRFSA